MSLSGYAVPIIATAEDGSEVMHFVDMKSCAKHFLRDIQTLYTALNKGSRATNRANGKMYFLDYELQYGKDYF